MTWFNQWFDQHLLKELNLHSTILMDNAAFHKKEEIRALAEKAGPCYRRWHFKSTLSDIPIKYSKTKGLFGMKVAFGVEGDIAKNMALGVEYNHTFLQPYTFQRPFDAANTTPHRVKPNYGAVLVRIMYKIK